MMSFKATIIASIDTATQIRIQYTDKSGRSEDFLLEPNYLFRYHQKLYVVAYNYRFNDVRVFRQSRIKSCNTTDSPSKHYPLSLSSIDLHGYFVEKDIEIITKPRSGTFNPDVASFGFKDGDQLQYPKKLRLSKMTEMGMCRSALEEWTLTQLNDDPSISSLTVEPFKIPYTFEGLRKNYIPDVMIKYHDGRTEIAEIKVSGDIQDPQNQAKFEAAKATCRRMGHTFKIIGVDGRGGRHNPTSTATDYADRAAVDTFDTRYVHRNKSQNSTKASQQTNPIKHATQSYRSSSNQWVWWVVAVLFSVILMLALFTK